MIRTAPVRDHLRLRAVHVLGFVAALALAGRLARRLRCVRRVRGPRRRCAQRAQEPQRCWFRTSSASASPSNSPPRPARTTLETLPKPRGLSQCMQQPHIQAAAQPREDRCAVTGPGRGARLAGAAPRRSAAAARVSAAHTPRPPPAARPPRPAPHRAPTLLRQQRAALPGTATAAPAVPPPCWLEPCPAPRLPRRQRPAQPGAATGALFQP